MPESFTAGFWQGFVKLVQIGLENCLTLGRD